MTHEKEVEEQQLPLNLRSGTGRGGEKVEEQTGSSLGKYEDTLPTPPHPTPKKLRLRYLLAGCS